MPESSSAPASTPEFNQISQSVRHYLTGETPANIDSFMRRLHAYGPDAAHLLKELYGERGDCLDCVTEPFGPRGQRDPHPPVGQATGTLSQRAALCPQVLAPLAALTAAGRTPRFERSATRPLGPFTGLVAATGGA